MKPLPWDLNNLLLLGRRIRHLVRKCCATFHMLSFHTWAKKKTILCFFFFSNMKVVMNLNYQSEEFTRFLIKNRLQSKKSVMDVLDYFTFTPQKKTGSWRLLI